jgi:hypothetical protein
MATAIQHYCDPAGTELEVRAVSEFEHYSKLADSSNPRRLREPRRCPRSIHRYSNDNSTESPPVAGGIRCCEICILEE